MDCPLIQTELVAYHFAVVTDEERGRIEAHLVGCTTCLRAYLALKRHIDGGAALDERPSEAARTRLRAEVAARFPHSPGSRLRRWLERPIPRYKGIAAAALAVAMAALVPVVAGNIQRFTSAQPSGERIDTSRPVPESLTVY